MRTELKTAAIHWPCSNQITQQVPAMFNQPFNEVFSLQMLICLPFLKPGLILKTSVGNKTLTSTHILPAM